MCWVDRVALGALVIIVAFFGVAAVSVGGPGATMGGPSSLAPLFSANFVRLLVMLIGVPWFVLRLLDLISGGPARRRQRGSFGPRLPPL